MDKVKRCFEFVEFNQSGTKFPPELRCSPNVLYNGNTLAMYIFKKWKCDCEEWMQHDVEITDKNGLIAFMVWLEHINTCPPEWTYKNLDPTIQVQSFMHSDIRDFNSRHGGGLVLRNTSHNIQERQNVLNEFNTSKYEAVPVMYWIKYTTLDIPDFIKVDPCTIDKNGESCMYYWIKYRKGIEVPEFIRHDPLLIRNNNNETAAMIWIKTNGTEPPSYLIHNPYAIDKFGENLAMYWIKYAKNPLQVPESLHFSELRANRYGLTFKTMWHQLTDEPLPDWVPGSIIKPRNTQIDVLELQDLDKSNLCQFMSKINATINKLINVKSQLSKLLKEKQELEYSMLIDSVNNNDRLNEINAQISELMSVL